MSWISNIRERQTRGIGALILILGGIVLGLYVGLWLMFIGGIVQIIEANRVPELVAMSIAIGVVKVIFAGFIGILSALALILPGYSLLKRT